jgi:hypothetical protein
MVCRAALPETNDRMELPSDETRPTPLAAFRRGGVIDGFAPTPTAGISVAERQPVWSMLASKLGKTVQNRHPNHR